jgi:hypothetical protein
VLQSTYLPQTQQLLQNPQAPTSLYATALLTGYINQARGQLAGEGNCVRAIGTFVTTPGVSIYPFSSLNLGVSATTGIAGAIRLNTLWIGVGSGQVYLTPRAWEWYGLYHLNNPVPNSGVPTVWSQYGQGASPPGAVTGSSFGGSIYIDPVPNGAYTMQCDCTCYPNALVLDTDVEAIPYLWTDAVPFFAAFWALLSSQTSARMQDAERYKKIYDDFVQRARRAATPEVNSTIYQQVPDPVQAAQLGVRNG